MTTVTKLRFPTADNRQITADTIDFRTDGADLTNGGAAQIPKPGNLSTDVENPLFVQYRPG
jgi:hypothetical protein